jgi:O-acetyl-ADP-ribose deacetylase (regulator of RNase III)
MAVRIRLYRGDITDCEADAIVNAANNHLWMGSGVAGAIKRRGGQKIEDEALSKGPIPVGEAVATGAGKLKARYVIHAAGMGQDLVPSERSVRDSTLNSLKRADELGLRSIAFPAIGCGVGGFPVDRAARIMIDAVNQFAAEKTSIEEVTFALFVQKDYDAFRSVLEVSQKQNR